MVSYHSMNLTDDRQSWGNGVIGVIHCSDKAIRQLSEGGVA